MISMQLFLYLIQLTIFQNFLPVLCILASWMPFWKSSSLFFLIVSLLSSLALWKLTVSTKRSLACLCSLSILFFFFLHSELYYMTLTFFLVLFFFAIASTRTAFSYSHISIFPISCAVRFSFPTFLYLIQSHLREPVCHPLLWMTLVSTLCSPVLWVGGLSPSYTPLLYYLFVSTKGSLPKGSQWPIFL